MLNSKHQIFKEKFGNRFFSNHLTFVLTTHLTCLILLLFSEFIHNSVYICEFIWLIVIPSCRLKVYLSGGMSLSGWKQCFDLDDQATGRASDQ